jgi:hypothetical protein
MSIVVVGSVAYDDVETTRGNVTDALGGSASFFAVAARFFTPVSVVAVVGSDFKAEDRQRLVDRGIDLRALEQREGKTFHWHGRYHEDMNVRDTISLELNVFEGFAPNLLPDQRRCDYLFLANIAPELQERVLSQVSTPKLVAGDTMNHWITETHDELVKLLSRIDILTLNDEAASTAGQARRIRCAAVQQGGNVRRAGLSARGSGRSDRRWRHVRRRHDGISCAAWPCD